MTHLPKFSKQAQARPCVVQVMRVSGTIKKSEEEAIQRARAAILKAKREAVDSATEGLNLILGQSDPDASTRVLRGKDSKGPATTADDQDDDEEMESDGND